MIEFLSTSAHSSRSRSTCTSHFAADSVFKNLHIEDVARAPLPASVGLIDLGGQRCDFFDGDGRFPSLLRPVQPVAPAAGRSSRDDVAQIAGGQGPRHSDIVRHIKERTFQKRQKSRHRPCEPMQRRFRLRDSAVSKIPSSSAIRQRQRIGGVQRDRQIRVARISSGKGIAPEGYMALDARDGAHSKRALPAASR